MWHFSMIYAGAVWTIPLIPVALSPSDAALHLRLFEPHFLVPWKFGIFTMILSVGFDMPENKSSLQRR